MVRGREMVLRCETYSQALQWARQECKFYNVPEPALELPDDAQSNDLPIFLRSPEQSPRRAVRFKKEISLSLGRRLG